MSFTRFYILIFSFFLFCCCKPVRQILNQKIETNIVSTKIYNKGTLPLLDIEIDGAKTQFLFDTGATFTTLRDSAIIENFEKKDFSSIGFARGADHKKIKNRLLTVAIKNDLFYSPNKVVGYIKSPSSTCDKTKPLYSGIIGMDFFFDQKSALQLDFSTNTISNISAVDLPKKIALKNYTLLSSECKNNRIFVFLTIEGKTFKCKLDTGYSGNIIIPESETVVFNNPNKMELIGTAYQTATSFTVGKETYYEKMPVTIGKTYVVSKVSVSSSIKAQNIGIEFMRGFDWIIDYNNNKVYVNRNQQPIASTFDKKIQYFAKVMDNQLQIVLKEKNQTSYAVGDAIVSVNGEKVTTENQCALQDFLNKTENWDTLSIEVNPKK